MAQSGLQAPPARVSHESVLLYDRAFVWGGRKERGGYHSRLDVFSVNMLSGEWREHTATPPDTPTPCHGACSAAIRNTIYSFGGWTGSKKHSDEFYKLDLDEMRWRKVEGGEIKPEGREGAGMCRVNGNSKLLLMGGYGRLPHTKHLQAQYKDNEHENGFGWNNELFEFDPCTDCWSALSVTGSKPSPRADHTLTTLDEKRAILFGGWDGEKSLNDLWLFDYGKKVWTQIRPSSSLWPQARSQHTVCTMVCDSQEIKLLLMGGHNAGAVVDCWLLDVHQGSGEKMMFDGGSVLSRGHSAHCVKLLDDTVVVSVFGGRDKSWSLLGSPCFYQWSRSLVIDVQEDICILFLSLDPRHPKVLHCGLAPAGATLHPSTRASHTREIDVRKKISHLPRNSEQEQGQIDQSNAQLPRERSVAKGNVRPSASPNDQQSDHGKIRKLEEKVKYLQQLNAKLAEEKCVVVRQLTEDVRKLKEDIQSLQQLNAQLTEERSMAVENVRQVTAVNDQLTGELSELNKDKQSLQQEFNRLSEDTATKTAQLCYKQRAIDTLRHEFEQVKAEKGVLQQRIDDMEILLRNAESASEAAEKRLTDRKEVLKVPLGDVQLSAKKLGSGAFGGVRVGYWRGCPVAVKRLHEELAKELYQRSLFEQEVEVISRLHHPNIAAICGVIHEEDAPFSLIMELLQASLAGVIVAARVSGKYLTVREQADVSHDCLSGLTYLHNLASPVLHGDIRPTNILMTSVMRAKLGDLGAARFTDSSLSAGPMSPLYAAPERFSGHILRNSKEADIYSMGVTLCELFSGDQMDRVDRPRQLRSVHQRDLRIVCLRMAAENIQERMMASAALVVNDRALLTEKYAQCPPRRMVRGVLDGVDKVTLCDKPW